MKDRRDRRGKRFGSDREARSASGRAIFNYISGLPEEQRVAALCAIYDVSPTTARLMFRYPQEVAISGGVKVRSPRSWTELVRPEEPPKTE